MSLRPVEPIPVRVTTLRVERLVSRRGTQRGKPTYGRMTKIKRIPDQLGDVAAEYAQLKMVLDLGNES